MKNFVKKLSIILISMVSLLLISSPSYSNKNKKQKEYGIKLLKHDEQQDYGEQILSYKEQQKKYKTQRDKIKKQKEEYTRQLKETMELQKERTEQMDQQTKLLKELVAHFKKESNLQDRYEKVLATWEKQQRQYQKYLDGLR